MKVRKVTICLVLCPCKITLMVFPFLEVKKIHAKLKHKVWDKNLYYINLGTVKWNRLSSQIKLGWNKL